MSGVPCNGCSTCCRGHQAVILVPEDEPNREHYRTRTIRHEDWGVDILLQNEAGDCAHLGPFGCSIYEHRPAVCREYDCRKQFLIMPRRDRRQLGNQQIWVEARKRLPSLDAEDRAELEGYRARASAGWRRMLGGSKA